jgi:catechol 2,3-dioxygenase-like lactoylglutathione lyase family enzyme
MEGVARPLALVPGVSSARDSARRPMLVKDLHDVAFLTADLDRLIAFYERIFDARVVLDGEDSGRRHALIEIGLHTMLHPFQVPAGEAPGRQRMLERGRLDHFAFTATSE